MAEEGKIEIWGARTHNLKNIDVEIPRNKITVITGLSGSGKSSLAFDTIYAEGQRRYIETFSAYARNFLGSSGRPDVDKITGLSPVISIDQKTSNHNPRSTVGTQTEIYDFLRLLYARVGEAYSYATGEKMVKYTEEKVVEMILSRYADHKIQILAPVVRGRKGHYRELFEAMRKKGFLYIRVDGEIQELVRGMKVDRYKNHDIEVVVDRLCVQDKDKERLQGSVKVAMKQGDGLIMVLDSEDGGTKFFSRRLMCPTTGISYSDPAPNTFSFNSPQGACPRCKGLGFVSDIDMKTVIPDERISIADGGIAPLGKYKNQMIFWQLQALLGSYGCTLNTPISDIPKEAMSEILDGSLEKIRIAGSICKTSSDYFTSFEGIIKYLRQMMETSDSTASQRWADQFLQQAECPECHGQRLCREALSYKIGGKNIAEVAGLDIRALYAWISSSALTGPAPAAETRRSQSGNSPFCRICNPAVESEGFAILSAESRRSQGSCKREQSSLLELPSAAETRRSQDRTRTIAGEILKEIGSRLEFLLKVGLDYLSLDRRSASLSGGESRRIRLATQIGSRLVNVLYILDEPSIGLHQRDNERLIASLKELRDIGNTIIVVEHDKDMMLAADYIVDIGPRASREGGQLMFQGTPAEMLKQHTLTSQYLNGERRIAANTAVRRHPTAGRISLRGCTGNNLQSVDVDFPLGQLIAVTGVSGSGKSTLINETLQPILAQHFYRSLKKPMPYSSVEGIDLIDKVISVDQSAIGKTPRSNPATYTGVFSDIRTLFSLLPEAKVRGYSPSRFSFNVKEGRCEACNGCGYKTIDMSFLPDVTVPCEACHGRRYNRETLEVRYRGKSIADVLDMTINQAVEFFDNIPHILHKIKTIRDVGLGYLKLSQPCTTLSGGECQRIKLATELTRKDTGKTLYLLDEPTTGLHFDDIRILMDVLRRLVDKGNTVIVIEHNLDVIRLADYIIDMGPEGGLRGGRLLFAGTPEQMASCKEGYTAESVFRNTLSVSSTL